MAKRLAVGDVYKVRGYGPGFEGDELDFIFEIVGEAFHEGRRYAVGMKQPLAPSEQQTVVFDEDGYGELLDGEFKWYAWEVSKASPRFRRQR